MTMKSLLLGAAAGIAAIGAAQAADLPMTKAEPVEYVKVCSTFGPGFFYIPGTDTCLKIGGEIRADYRAYGNTKHETRDVNRVAFQGEGRIWFDARTDTDPRHRGDIDPVATADAIGMIGGGSRTVTRRHSGINCHSLALALRS